MKSIISCTPHESFSFSFSKRRYLQQWRRKNVSEGCHDEEEDGGDILTFISSEDEDDDDEPRYVHHQLTISDPMPVDMWRRKKTAPIAIISRLVRSSAVSLFHQTSSNPSPSLLISSKKVIGTLFGHRRGHVCLALQDGHKSRPGFLIELSMFTCVLVREMASGPVRIALECDKKLEKKREGVGLLEEPLWRAFCNGRKCGYAMRRECGAEEWRVLRALEPISTGAGVLPPELVALSVASDPRQHYSTNGAGDAADGSRHPEIKEADEFMYMRAKFERVAVSKDSEAFHMMMMNPLGSGSAGAPPAQLCVYLLRV